MEKGQREGDVYRSEEFNNSASRVDISENAVTPQEVRSLHRQAHNVVFLTKKEKDIQGMEL